MQDGTDVDAGVGKVETRLARIALPEKGFALECGRTLPELTIAYESYGDLAADKGNVIFICHALTGDAHVAGYHDDPDGPRGWWDEMIGPGKGIDTNYYHVVCANILGGCQGTTGPASLNPATGRPYGSDFPPVTVGDMVDAHRLLLDYLGIAKLAAVIGGSFGGMQALDWTMRYPATVRRCICIATGKSLSSQALAFDIVGREAITSDPHWQGGDYYASGTAPDFGLALARKLGHITYLSPEMMETKFGRVKTSGASVGEHEGPSMFQVESYLAHQGAKFIRRFDANSYVCITRAMDNYDLVEQYGSLTEAFEPICAKMLVVALSSDWLFPPEQSVELAQALLQSGKNVSYCRLQAPHGHDAFLVDIRHLTEVIHAFLPWVDAAERRKNDVDSTDALEQSRSFGMIGNWIPCGARVLDIGCGNGDLLTLLARSRAVHGVGLDIDLSHVIDVIDQGHDMFQGNADEGLGCIPNAAFDCAVLSETLHVLSKPGTVIREMLRVAKEGIVSFPSAGHWRRRLKLLFAGTMPLRPAETHSDSGASTVMQAFTLRDFEALCRAHDVDILEMACVPSGLASRILVKAGLCRLGADRVVARLARKKPGRTSRPPCVAYDKERMTRRGNVEGREKKAR